MARHFLSLFLLCAALSQVMGRHTELEEIVLYDRALKDYILVCTQKPVDIALIIDASASIWPRNFSLGQKFVADFLDMYDIGPDKVRVAAVTYGRGVYAQDAFGFTKYTTKEDVKRAIQGFPYRAGDRTETWLGLDYMRTRQMSQARPGVPHVAIVLTDGNSQVPSKTAEAARLARADGIKMVAIGVGNTIGREELVNIAGDEKKVFHVNRYDELDHIKDMLAYQTCEEIPVTTTPPPADSCGKTNPSDILFVLDRARLGPDGNGFAAQLASHIVQAEGMTEGMHYGMTTLLCPEGAGFESRSFETVDEALVQVNAYDRDVLADIVRRAVTSTSNARPETRHQMVVFLGEKIDNTADLLAALEEATMESIELYFSDTGKTDPKLLEELSGYGTLLGPGSSRQQAERFLTELCPEIFG